MDVNKESNSVFSNIAATARLEKELTTKLGINPATNKPFEIQIVGPYELRKFPPAEIASIERIAYDPLGSFAVTGAYSDKNLETLANYQIAIALEQDASSSGAQIIALTTTKELTIADIETLLGYPVKVVK